MKGNPITRADLKPGDEVEIRTRFTVEKVGNCGVTTVRLAGSVAPTGLRYSELDAAEIRLLPKVGGEEAHQPTIGGFSGLGVEAPPQPPADSFAKIAEEARGQRGLPIYDNDDGGLARRLVGRLATLLVEQGAGR